MLIRQSKIWLYIIFTEFINYKIDYSDDYLELKNKFQILPKIFKTTSLFYR